MASCRAHAAPPSRFGEEELASIGPVAAGPVVVGLHNCARERAN
ncbi:MAG: hypothetical protein WKG07_06615 [Hymenobacter sp.]